MVLETLGSRIDIGRLILNEPSVEETAFNPDTDVTESDWEHMQQSLSQLQESTSLSHFYSFLQLGESMTLLFPGKNIGVKNDSWTSCEGKLNSMIGGSDDPDDYETSFGLLTHSLASAKIIFPDQPEIKRLSEICKDEMIRFLHKAHSDHDLLLYLSLASSVAVLFPEQSFRQNLEIDDDTLDEINDISLFTEREHVSAWFSYALHLGTARLLYPQYKPDVSMEAWRKMKECLDAFRNTGELTTSWTNFGKVAMNMKLIAADKVEVTNQGIEIVMPQPQKPFQEPIPALPERRRFRKIAF